MLRKERVDRAEVLQRLSRVHAAQDYEARRKLFFRDEPSLRADKRNLFAYLLGFMIGDAAKRRTSPRSEMFLEVQLTKKHKENERLGELVGLCANACGVYYYKINYRFVN